MSKKKILIIKGHGGNDCGAVANGLVEKTMNKITAEAMYNLLKGYSQLEVTLDSDNTNVDEEVNLANSGKFDIVISVHYNAGGGDGFEAYYYSSNSNAKKLCSHIEERVKGIGQNSRGIKTGDSYKIIRKVTPMSIILEGGFIDNKNDITLFDCENKWRAFGIAYGKGVLDYLGIKETVDITATENTSNSVMYRVIAGSYANRENANKQIEALKKLGITNAFIDIYKK